MSEISQKKCPQCGKLLVEKYRPFCSSRCADIDLGGWLSEKYRLPVNDENDEEADQTASGHEDTDIE